MKDYLFNFLMLTIFSLLSYVLIICIIHGDKKMLPKGKASWYSIESCQREGTSGIWTASGEKFNEEAMTCALRHYDFGGYYEVCNLHNAKCVTVRHNDYGASSKYPERIIDLSKGAFRKIADLDKGIIEVSVRRLK